MRSTSGQVGIQRITKASGVYLYLWIPKEFSHSGKGLKYSLKLQDNPANYAKADLIRRQVQIDLEMGRFVWSEKDQYLESGVKKTLISKPLTPQKVWGLYNAAPHDAKASTKAIREGIGKIINAAPTNPAQLVNHLKETATEYRAAQVIRYLQAAYRWAVKKGLTYTNPLANIDQPMPKTKSGANPFSPDEKLKALKIVELTQWANFFKFLIFTGCRPSEAVGLTWEQIDRDSIKFDRSVSWICGKPVESTLSKTNRERYFPLHEKLISLLDSIPRQSYLVFGCGETYLNYPMFYCWWKRTIARWKPSSPYSCRDTFITDQILAGVPIAVVAKWCDNSVGIIESRYLKVLPREFTPRF